MLVRSLAAGSGPDRPRARTDSCWGVPGRSNDTAPRPQPRVVGVAAAAATGGQHDIPVEGFGGARLLVSDVRVALRPLDEARQRIVERLFAVSRDQSWPVTLTALALQQLVICANLSTSLVGVDLMGRDAFLSSSVPRALVRTAPCRRARNSSSLPARKSAFLCW